MSTAIPHEEDERLRALWAGAVDIEPLGPSPSDRIKLRGYNIRVKFPEAFFAAYHTFEAVTAVGSAIAVHATWPIAISKCYQVAMSLFSTLV